ncbi:beta-channel forming cytolysin [Bacillus pseudomycoides]|uniref:beta-channel forming cytolysin n=1 Tax=Bacillus pseudomycoides TaxID=64104 RepID=UPI000BF7BC04|nr:beta-channel forming cytolysin [Bacillus pseudomycoides]PFX40374.1 beta-channel forming cytolysin [Bacillus pseudomycoides]PFZ75275.1 beta-channel forming cytolysin [Bacillus pseudomycoides]PGE08591.1 beta-channel forming cytolysin [Bacillus pseudomycoides]PHB15360.1 beta-channel forming cytolysin [Bacillus pseudomycoides]
MTTKRKNMKKNKKILQALTLATTVVGGSLAFSSTSAHADSLKSIEEIGSGAKVMNNLDTTYHSDANIKNSIKVSFIDDPTVNKKYAIVSTEGSNIGSNLDYRNHDYYNASLIWTSAFKTGLEITSNDSAAFYKVLPKNNIETKNVSSTVAYNVGGGLEVKQDTGASGSVTAGASWSTTVSYDQSDYKTFLENSTDKKVDWKVAFDKFYNGNGFYDRDSFSSIFNGNQLFMVTTSGLRSAIENLVPQDKLPSLTAYGFQPGTIAIITADKNEESTDLAVKHSREKDDYRMFKPVSWKGYNEKNVPLDENQNTSVDQYKIDWKNNKIVHQ